MTPPTVSFPPAVFANRYISLDQLRHSGLPLEETTYLALGGGLGSFAWVDHLRICGARPDQIMAIGVEEKPYGRYRRLCRHSQIPPQARIRSDSGATIDNIWGWPGYGLREMWRAGRQGKVGHAARIAWQLFSEPSLAAVYTPRSGDVYDAIDREAQRIGWPRIWRFGRIRAIRKSNDGRYVVAYSQSRPGTDGRHRLVVAPYLHLATGYPGIRFLPDLQAYRAHTGDFQCVVNAYENHNHVYRQLQVQGGQVLLRGRGIVASRILQRLCDVRRHNPHVTVLHLVRSPKEKGARYGLARRHVEHHWEMQPFNWPKGAFSGDLRAVLERADDEKRDRLLATWGGTTTAGRRAWRQSVSRGLREGWYRICFGEAQRVQGDGNGRLLTTIRENGRAAATYLRSDFIIDATGLNARIDHNPLLADLLAHYRLPRNPRGNLAVANDFEVVAMRNGPGRLYAAGIITWGGPLAPADSFLGLQYAAQCAVDSLAALRAPGLYRLNGLRSAAQWLRWALGAVP